MIEDNGRCFVKQLFKCPKTVVRLMSRYQAPVTVNSQAPVTLTGFRNDVKLLKRRQALATSQAPEVIASTDGY
jgi:hypothetical protein